MVLPMVLPIQIRFSKVVCGMFVRTRLPLQHSPLLPIASYDLLTAAKLSLSLLLLLQMARMCSSTRWMAVSTRL